MSYYFPININNRRLHFLKLQQIKNAKNIPQPTFSFLVKNSDSPMLVSVDTPTPQLISDSGRQHNVKFEDPSPGKFVIHKMKVSPYGEIPTYMVEIVHSKTDKKSSESIFLKTQGTLGRGDGENFARIFIDSSVNKDDEHDIVISEFVLLFSYQPQNGDVEYQDAVKIHIYSEDNDVSSCALDFGSEASQIRFGGTNANNQIINTFLKFGKYQAKEYWQGAPNDPLYKSVFFINRNSGVTNFAELPKVGNDSALVRPLMSANEAPSKYENYELLPNLKLVEIGSRQIEWTGDEIKVCEGSNIQVGSMSTLASEELRESILRLILSNFLHCILKDGFSNADRYLRMVLLVPNVYYQSKIHGLITQLYQDFNTIQKSKNRYKHCKGIEVQVVSESDASFIGIDHLKFENGLHYLIVDAGKGTTDFSILQSSKKGSRKNFNSLYRDGIPASGNVITYAFYEVLKTFLQSKGIDVDNYLRNAEIATTLGFVNLIEKLKVNYNENNNYLFDKQKAQNIKDLGSLNAYLKEQIAEGRTLPDCKEYINKKIAILVDCIKNSLDNFMSENSRVKFRYVLLSGRGFLFDPFKQATIQMLKDQGWVYPKIESEDIFVKINCNDAKTKCLEGAIAIEKACHVNCNSSLIGTPIIRYPDSTSKIKGLYYKLRNMLNMLGSKTELIDMKFFYKGSDSVIGKNLDLIIGGRKYDLDSNDQIASADSVEEKSVFFVGEGFLCQQEHSAFLIAEKQFTHTHAKTDDLVKEALFPHNITNINEMSVDNSNNEKMQKKATQTPPNGALNNAKTNERNNPEFTNDDRIDIEIQ